MRSEDLEGRMAVLQHLREGLRETEPLEWARHTVRLAHLLLERSALRRKSESVGEAIVECESILAVVSREQEPDLWGESQSILAIALSESTSGSQDDNLDQAIAACRSALEIFRRDVFPEEWASMMNILGSACLRRSRGGLSQNIEEARIAFEAALEIRTRERHPRSWAYIQNNLAVLYRERLDGDPAENVEQAIAAGTGALEILNSDEDFAEWVMASNNLASAYRFRILGDPGDNLERAMLLYAGVADRLDPEQEPELWADTWHNLAALYLERPGGDRRENLESAVAAGERSLAVRSRETEPVPWARTALLLAGVYSELTGGDRTENVERAVESTHRALEIITFESRPLEWAGGMMNMAALYLQRQRARRDVNVEAAILACHQAMIVFRRETLPLDWARTMKILGTAYVYRPRGERVENLGRAIEAFGQALEVVAPDRHPLLHAGLLQGLANSLVELEGCSRNSHRHVRQAVALYEAALRTRARDVDAYEWARLQHNLGHAWEVVARGPRSRGYRAGRAAFREALAVRTLEAYPNEHRITQRRLGHLYFGARRWREAEGAYAAAMAGLERVYSTVSTPDARQAELAGVREVALCAAYAQARMGRPETAVETIEKSRTRTLAETLAREAAALRIMSAEDRAAWLGAVGRIRELEAEARAADPTDPRPFLEASAALREATQRLLDLGERIRPQAVDLAPGPLDRSEIGAIVGHAGRPLVYLLATRHGSLALPVLPDSPAGDVEQALWLDGFTAGDLGSYLEEKGSYLSASLSGEPRAIETALDGALPLLHDALMRPLGQWVIAQGSRAAILVPCGALGLLPLCAATDDVLWSVVPSARVLKEVVARLQAPAAPPRCFLGVANPRSSHPPLPCGEIETDEAASFFDTERRRCLRGSEATRSTLAAGLGGVTHLHFACHGQFYPWIPLESGLGLADHEALTLREIMAGSLDLAHVRLVVLSSCQTAFIEYQRTPDEGLSIPTAFLQAGVPGVISSLWTASDLSATLLVREFYRKHVGEGLEPADALQCARRRLRQGTASDLGVAALCEEWLERSGGRDRRAYLALRHHRIHSEAVPFHHPRHWAGFVLSGL